jgi:cytochrome c oxidase cbb3-type subunit 4
MQMFHSLWTLALFVLFIAIIFWAWSSKRKTEFDEAARLPLDDDQPLAKEETNG